jgi:hypothetical protein
VNNDICVLNYDGALSKVGEQDDLAIVEYASPKTRSKAAGAECADDTLFATTDYNLRMMRSRQRMLKDAEARAYAFVNQFQGASGKKLDPKQWSDESWVVVRVINPNGVNNTTGHFDLRDRCGLKKKPSLTILGIRDRDQGRLVRYDGPSGSDRECGTGTLFVAYFELDRYIPDESF